jgi:hypothetical protein
MSVNAYRYHISSQINAEQLMSNVHAIGHYQRDTDWSTIDCDNVIGGLLNKFDELYEAAQPNESGEEQTRMVIPIGGVVFAHDFEVDSFGNRSPKISYLVDGQQRKRHLSLMITAVNKHYPSVQLGNLVPVKRSNDGVFYPVVSHPDTNAYMTELWKSKGAAVKSKPNANLSVRTLDTNYRHIEAMVKNLGWSLEKMEAFIEFFKYNVTFSTKEVLLEDAAKAFMDANTNHPNLKGYQLFKAGVSSHLNYDDSKAAAFSLTYDAYITKLITEYGVAKGKVDEHVVSILRALYATDTGTTGVASLDSLNRPWQWIEANTAKIGLITNEAWEKLAFVQIPLMFKALFIILDGEKKRAPETRYIYERQSLGGDYAHATMLSHICDFHEDSIDTLKLKLNNAAKYSIRLTDTYERSSKRRLDGKVRPKTIEMMNGLRGKTAAEGKANMIQLFKKTIEEFAAEGYTVSTSVREGSSSFNNFSLRAVESMLSEMASEDRQESIWKYKAKDDSLALSIEHLIPTTYGRNGETAFTVFDAPNYRELLCMQGLLPLSYNSAIQDKPIKDKLSTYLLGGGIWLSSLSEGFYNDKSEVQSVKLREALKANKLSLTPIQGDEIDMDFIEKRNDLFNVLLDMYHNLAGLEVEIASPDDSEGESESRLESVASLTTQLAN